VNIELIGYMSSILLGFCGLPAAIESIIKKQCNIPYSLIIPWYLGEICATIYLLGTEISPLIWNYLVNIILISIMIYYKVRKK
jgi:uncharacterized protein with PQ loop repeat